MRALVTGGAGFIGSVLVERLVAEGHSVDVVDDLSTGLLENLAEARADRTGELRIHQADLRSPDVVELIARRTPEVVFHLAARVEVGSAVEEAEVNLLGSLRVVEAALAAGAAKFVFASDAAALYGSVASGGGAPLREAQAGPSATPFGVSKQMVVEHLRLARESVGMEFTALALATVYGPRDRRGVVGRLVGGLLESGADPVPVPGGAVDLVYVDDVVDAFVRAATRGGGLVCNVGSGVAVAVPDVARAAAAQAGVPDAATVLTSGASAPALDAGRARIHLGWSPWTALDEGLAHTLRWTAAHPT